MSYLKRKLIPGPASDPGCSPEWSALGVAQLAWFIANRHVAQVITFPIVSSVPGAIGLLWSLFVFNEILVFSTVY